MIALSGYMAEGRANWPPSYRLARRERLEALALTIKLGRISKEMYDELAAITRRIMDNPDWQQLRDSIARVLAQVPSLDREDLARLAEANHVPIPEEEAYT